MEARCIEIYNNHTLIEIIDTEIRYKEKLVKLIGFLNNKKLASNKTLEQFKHCIEQFKLISDRFLANIEESKQAIKNDDECKRKHLEAERLGLVGLFFANYTPYIKALEIYQQLSRMEQVPEALQTLWNNEKDEFDSLMVQPYQRGPRYQLLVQELLKQKGIVPEQKEMLTKLRNKIEEQLKPFSSAGQEQHNSSETIFNFLTSAYIYRVNLVTRTFSYRGLLPIGIHKDEKINALDALCAFINGDRETSLAPFAKALQDGRLYRLIEDKLQEVDERLYKAFTKKLLVDQLIEYQTKLNARSSDFSNFFKTGYSKSTKLAAVSEMIKALNTENGEYPISFHAALNNGALGQILTQWQHCFGELPVQHPGLSLRA